jgi:hypothetical protein
MTTALSLLRHVLTGFGTHLASYTMSAGTISTGLKRLKREDDHSIPSIFDVNNVKPHIAYTIKPRLSSSSSARHTVS